jgi:hypothetical protein
VIIFWSPTSQISLPYSLFLLVYLFIYCSALVLYHLALSPKIEKEKAFQTFKSPATITKNHFILA